MFKPFIGDCINPECERTGVPIPVRSGICDKCNYEKKQRAKQSNNGASSSINSDRTSGVCLYNEKGEEVAPSSSSQIMVRKTIKKKPIQYRRKRTGEAEVFEEIWNALEEKTCFVCGRQINEPTASNFAHILPKSLNKYPLFKLNPENIKLFCHDSYYSCHHRFDKEPRSTLKEPMWKKVFELEEKLKEKYKLLKSSL